MPMTPARSLSLGSAMSRLELPQHSQKDYRAGGNGGPCSQPALPVIEVNHMSAGTYLDGPEDVVGAENGGFLVVEPGMPVRVVTIEEHYVARTCELSPERHRSGLIVNNPHPARSRFAS